MRRLARTASPTYRRIDNSVGAKMIATDSLASVDGGVTGALAGTTRAGTYLWCVRAPSSPRPRHGRAKPTRAPPPRRRGWDTKESIKLINNVLKGNYAVTMPLIEEVALGGKASPSRGGMPRLRRHRAAEPLSAPCAMPRRERSGGARGSVHSTPEAVSRRPSLVDGLCVLPGQPHRWAGSRLLSRIEGRRSPWHW